jgi:predicted SAM-dependent methyltransferase
MRRILLFFLSHRTLALLRWDLHFLNVRFWNFILQRHAAINKFLYTDGKKYLNLGSGPRGISSNEWLNIDGFKDTNVQFFCDFSRPIPIPNNCLDGIFTEHVIEHFDSEYGRRVMAECHRMLKKGGVIRIIVPNGHRILKSYFGAPEKIVSYKNPNTGQPMEAVNMWFYQRYEHQCIYDAPFLIQTLKSIGFETAEESSFRNSVFSEQEMLLDNSKYEWESLYVEAIK